MKRVFLTVMLIATLFAPVPSHAQDVWVNGYYRSDGTYVRPHYQSRPDGQRWNNYGPSMNPSQDFNPYSRDWDGDGTANAFDMDDDNDGWIDDLDNSQYGW